MRYFIKRIIILLITLFLVSIITFTAFSILPGDAGRVVLGTNASQEQVDAYNAKLGLDKPVVQRYFSWIGKALTGNLGESYKYSVSVGELISSRIPVTLTLAVISLLIVIVISVPIGVISAMKENSAADNVFMLSGQVIMAIPGFFLGIILSWIFGVLLNWFIPGQYISYSENLGGFFAYLIIPAIAIALPKIGMSVKFLRASVIEQKNAGYVKTARGIGLKKREIIYRHILKNALIPAVTFFGIIAADIIAGSIVIEQVFQIPGVGRLLYDAVASRDLPLAQGLILYIAFMVILINFVVDIIYKLIDPRVEV